MGGISPSASARIGGRLPALTPMRIGMPRSLASRDDRLHLVGVADVAGVEAQAVEAGSIAARAQR